VNAYCTYFDRGYLAQGLALWHSLVAHDAAAVLWVLALDEETADVLRARREPALRVLPLAELLAADPELAAARDNRPRSEFVFALTPGLVRHLLRTPPEIERLAYLDADLYFFGDPAPLWAELGAGSVLIVPHGYPPWHDDTGWYGRCNVGVLGFRADANARACVDWWRARCLESTALANDGSRYGDQKYLDAWPRRFPGVVVARHPGLNVAPWNWAARRFTLARDAVRVDGAPLLVFHFAQFRPVSGRWFDSGQLEYGIMPLRLRSRLYGEYWQALERAVEDIREVRPGFDLATRGWRAALGAWHLALLRLAWGQFWVRLGPWWVSGRLGVGRWSGRALGWYRARQRSAPQRPPVVVVVTPTLGKSPWLAETVASVAALSVPCTHVLVAPAAAVAGLREKFPRATVVAEPPGAGGMYAAINAGAAAAEEWDLLTYLNDDDVLLPGFAAVVRVAAACGDQPRIVYGGVVLIDAQGRRLGAIPISSRPAHHRALYAERLEPVYQHGTVVTRAAWAQLGGFDATLRFCGDSEFLARACVSGVPAVCAGRTPVAAFRLRAGQLTKHRAAMDGERARVDAQLGLRAGPGARERLWARWVFRLTNLPIYAERIARHGFVTFDELLQRAGAPRPPPPRA
jgi:hypothetical protein